MEQEIREQLDGTISIVDNAYRRTIFRKFTDYLSFLVIAPVLLIAASSATLLLERGVDFLAENWLFFRGIKPLLEVLFRLLPFLIVWILFTFVYAFLPNTRVKFSAALFGGIIAGTIYQLLQAGYLETKFHHKNY